MRRSNPVRVTAGLALAVGLCVSAVGPVGAQSPGSDKPFAGTTLTMWEFETPIADTHGKHLQEFEDATGIHVDQLTLTEGAYVDKVKLAQLAKDSAPDVYYTDFAFKGDVVDRGAEEYLDDYLADPAKTSAEYNAADISSGLMGLCQIDGKQICLPFFSNGTFYYYNKQILADAGITEPPTTIDDIIAIAKATNDPAKGIAGICMRGSAESANQYSAYLMSQYFLPYDDNKAVILDKDYRPLYDTPEAQTWLTDYVDLMQNYAPAGVQSYGYLDCNRDFEQGKVAQYWEADPWIGEFLDPTKSSIVDDVGFAVLPCPANNPDHCIANAGGGWYLNKYSEHKDAAWELMKWLTNEENQVKWGIEDKSTFQVTRNAALPQVATGVGFPQEVSDALAYAHAHAHPSPFPPIPNISDMVTITSRMLTQVVAGQLSIDDGLAQAQEDTIKSMVDNGLLAQP